MDEDEEYGSDDDTELDVGSLILITTDDGYEAGILLGTGLVGVRLRVTHRFERLETKVSEKDKKYLMGVIRSMNRIELVRYAMETNKLAFLKKREELVDYCIAEAVADLKGRLPVRNVLKALSRPVSSFIPMERIVLIQSFTEWDEEQTLRAFEFEPTLAED